MKKMIVVALFALLFGLGACGRPQQQAPGAGTQPPPEGGLAPQGTTSQMGTGTGGGQGGSTGTTTQPGSPMGTGTSTGTGGGY